MVKLPLKLRLNRRLVVDSTLFGVLLTLLVAAADLFGFLAPLERWVYDRRTAACQVWTPPPTDQLVHVDIDDAALESMGRWPWHRSVIADVLDEIRLAGPKAVALDVLFPEPEEPQYLPRFDRKIDHDANLAAALRRLDCGLVAASFPFTQERVSAVYAPVRAALSRDPTMSEADVAAVLRSQGFDLPNLNDLVHADFYRARAEAVYERVAAEGDALPRQEMLAKLLPGVDPALDSPLLRAFDKQYANFQAAEELRRLALPLPKGAPPLFAGKLKYAPVAPIGRAAQAGGFVDYPQSSDGTVRAVPLFVQSDAVVYPQLGLALACWALGTDPRQLRLTDDAVVVPRPGKADLVIPVRTLPSRDLLRVERDVPMAADVAWFGTGEWERMYDFPRHEETKQHLPIAFVWDACLARDKIARNFEAADQAMGDVMPDDLVVKFTTAPPLAPGDIAGLNGRIAEVLANVHRSGIDELQGDQLKTAQASVEKLRNILKENPGLQAGLERQRAQLRSQLAGRAVLIGWTATASIADFLPTSLHARCPGVVLHGVIFNQVMTGEAWRTLPRWATLLATLAVGLLTTLAVSFLSPAKALASAVLLAAGYLLVNGYLLFDYGNLILGAAGPVVAIGAVWSGGTLAKLGMERWERARITRRFRSYADPKLVDYVLKHPETNVFEGQVRELTVVYIDLVGFTKLTESMGSGTVQLLNELWSALLPVIKKNDALVNKFLGDGIMFFYGAPEQSPHHARDAVRTVLDVRKALDAFNASAAAKGWPPQALRFGISTGNMVVGDAGAPMQERADYTVIGDYSNLGARLESANKAVGTTILMTDRTVELAGDGFLFRPIGKLCVVGKQSAVMTYEVVARVADATDAEKSLADHTAAMVDAFLQGRVHDCLAAVERMEVAHGRSKLTALYRERCEHFLHDPAAGPFDCQIVLSEK